MRDDRRGRRRDGNGPTVDPASFADDENWHGGFYELAIALGPRHDPRLDAAIGAVWADPRVHGCYVDRHREPQAQEPVACSLSSLDEADHLRGTAQLPSGARVVCGTVIIREEDSGLDWLDFYLPVGALTRVDDRVGGFPFGDDGGAASLAWRAPIDEWLSAMGKRVFAAAPFEYALIGFEATGESPPSPDATDTPSAERSVGYLVPRHGRLEYLPATY